MRKIDADESRNTGNTETMVAVDEPVEKKFGNVQRAYNEGFASASGVKGETAETDGLVIHPEKLDDSNPHGTPDSIENENPGLADN